MQTGLKRPSQTPASPGSSSSDHDAFSQKKKKMTHFANEGDDEPVDDSEWRSQTYIWQLEERVRLLEEENQQLNQDLKRFRLLPIPNNPTDEDSVGPAFLNLTSQIKDLHTHNLVKALSDAMRKATLHTQEMRVNSKQPRSRPPPAEYPQNNEVHVAHPDVSIHPTPSVKARPYSSKQSIVSSQCIPLSLSDIKKDVQTARENLSTIELDIRRAKASLKDVREDIEVSSKTHADVLEMLTAEQEGHTSTKVKLQALRQTLRSAMEQD